VGEFFRTRRARIVDVAQGTGLVRSPSAALAEARANLDEAVRLSLDANRALSQEVLLDADVIREPFTLTA
jgi:hypothetical protein